MCKVESRHYGERHWINAPTQGQCHLYPWESWDEHRDVESEQILFTLRTVCVVRDAPFPLDAGKSSVFPAACSLQECLSLPAEPCSRIYRLSMLRVDSSIHSEPSSRKLHIWPQGTVHSDSTLALKLCTDHLHLLYTALNVSIEVRFGFHLQDTSPNVQKYFKL